MSISLKIAAVFATMNREQTALSCIMALAAQTRPPELVVVADNVSSDTTVSTLRSVSDLPFALKVIEMDDNRGNAGGVEVAMEFAFLQESDAVWILDDDSLPRCGALAALLAEPWQANVVRHPLQIDPRSNRLTWPQWIPHHGGWKLAHRPEDLPLAETFPSRSSWTGALVSREVRKRVGPVNGELFIRGEDEDYPWRIAQEGFRFECVRGAILDHPGPEDLLHWVFFGKNFFIERNLSDWKLYYKVRNMVWLKRRKSAISAITTGMTYAITTMCLEGPGRLGLVLSAIGDGWRGTLGKWKGH